MVDVISIVAPIILAVLTAFLAGYALSVHNRVKIFRKIRRNENYGLLNVLNNNKKIIKTIMVNFKNDSVTRGKNLWVFSQNQLYMKGNEEKTINTENTVKYEEGIPVLYVDEVHFTPVEFTQEETRADSRSILQMLIRWATNQRNKDTAVAENTNKIVLISLLLLIIIGAGLYYIHTEVQAAMQAMAGTNARLDMIEAKLGISGSVIINPTPTGR